MEQKAICVKCGEMYPIREMSGYSVATITKPIKKPEDIKHIANYVCKGCLNGDRTREM